MISKHSQTRMAEFLAAKRMRGEACDMADGCMRKPVGTVRMRLNPPGDDRVTCALHTGGRILWAFGTRSPYIADRK